MNDWYVLLAVLAMGTVTFLIRALPFIGTRWLRDSLLAQRVGRFLPPAIMTLLLLHSTLDLGLQASDQLLPAIVAVLVVLGMQLRLRQPLLSIAAGTVLYMLWIQLA